MRCSGTGARSILGPVVLFAVFGYEAFLGLTFGFVLAQLLALIQGRFELDPVFFPLAALWAIIIPHWESVLTGASRGVRAAVIGVVVAGALAGLAFLRAPEGGAERGRPEEG